MRESKEYVLNPKNRTTAFLVGHKAWEKWSENGLLEGEKPLVYLKRHMDIINMSFETDTDPIFGLQDVHLTPIVVLVNEDWIANADWVTRQLTNGETYGRWSWDLDYTPEKFLTNDHVDPKTGKLVDLFKLHELGHYSLYLPHLYSIFNSDLDSWKKSLDDNFPIGEPDKVNFYGLAEDGQLDIFNFINGGNPYSQPERLFIRRVVSDLDTTSDKFIGGRLMYDILKYDFGPAYSISGFSSKIDEVPIYRSKIAEADWNNNFSWSFSEDNKTVIDVKNGSVDLPLEYIKPFDDNYLQPSQEYPITAFALKMGDRFLAFTNLHLVYWHWKEQIKNGEKNIGRFGKSYPVELSKDDWI